MKNIVGLSLSNSKNHNYENWLKENNVSYFILDWDKNNFDDIKNCSSLILTGGFDIAENPGRDGFEFLLLDYVFENKMPLLAICRGLQVLNYKLGGTLISDIETIRGVNHRKLENGEDRIHNVTISHDSLLFEITGQINGDVNSSHHQSIDLLAEELMISGKADDGIIEAVEWSDKTHKPFMLAVQWHPERFKDSTSPFSQNIIERFIQETEKI